jgi:hypothetical protein
MTRLLLVVATIVIGLGIGFALAYHTFENPPQQIALVRGATIIAAPFGFVYLSFRRRPHPGKSEGMDPDL